MSKLDCFTRFDEVSHWLSKTQELIATADYSNTAFGESFHELRRKSRKAKFALVVALYQFQHEMEARATDTDHR